MDIFNIRQELKVGKTIYDLNIRVTFYARVSTEKDEQLNSLDNQISYYENFIQNNTNWTYVKGYIDEGLSAITATKRDNFQRMIKDAESGVFDLIITKEITRFARNTLDSIKFTRDLITYGVGVYFQNDNICTLDDDSELRLTIMSGIAQDELRKLSSRIKFGHAQAIKNHVVLGNSRLFGYEKEGKRLVINEEQAQMVREIYNLYATGKYSTKKIEGILWNNGYKNYNGNKIGHSTITNIISNPKYKGYYVGNKVKIVNMFTKQQKFLDESEWVMFKDETGDIVPEIVDEELWEKANEILKYRSAAVKERQNRVTHKNLLTGKLFCSHCGAPYYRKDSKSRKGESISKWICSGKINNGSDSCPSTAIYENEIKDVIFDIFKSIDETDINNTIKKYMNFIKELDDKNSYVSQIKNLEKRKEIVEMKKSKILDFNVQGKLSDNDFLKTNDSLLNEITEIENKIEEINKKIEIFDTVDEKTKLIRISINKAIEQAKEGIIDVSFVENYINKIVVEPITDDKEKNSKRMMLTIYLNKHKIYYELIKGRSGHIFKKMIKAYEDGMK